MRTITRDEWGAREPTNVLRTTWGSRTEFVVHYTGADENQTWRSIQDYHMDVRGWSDIGYNFGVDNRTGDLVILRGWMAVGAHATGHNTSGIGVVVKGLDHADRQDVTLEALRTVRGLYDAANAYRRGAGFAGQLAIRGHRDVGSTDCPGDELYAWLHAGMQLPPDDDQEVTMPLLRIRPKGFPHVFAIFPGGAVRHIGPAEHAFYTASKVPLVEGPVAEGEMLARAAGIAWPPAPAA